MERKEQHRQYVTSKEILRFSSYYYLVVLLHLLSLHDSKFLLANIHQQSILPVSPHLLCFRRLASAASPHLPRPTGLLVMADEVFRVGSVRVFHPNPQQPPSPLEACIITRPRENTWVLGLELRDQQFAVVYDGLADRHQEQMGTRIEDATSQSTDDNPDPILTVAYECLRQLMPLDLLPLAGSRPLSKLITTPTIYLQMWSNGATASAEPPCKWSPFKKIPRSGTGVS